MLTTRTLLPTFDRLARMDHELDRLVNEMWGQNARATTDGRWFPSLDVAEREEGYEIVVELPGVNPNDVEISFDRGNLILRGSKVPSFAADTETDGETSRRGTVLMRERISGTFERVLQLPTDVDEDRITAQYDNGLLRIRVPKAEAARPRRITISGANTSSSQKQLNR
jgi:HSP20 family protein